MKVNIRRRDDDADRRLGELLAAERRGDAAPLIEALSDPDNRAAAARGLGNLGATEAVPSLMRLLSANDPVVRWRAVESLGKLGAGDAADRLLEIAERDEADWVRSWAMGTLADLQAAGILDHDRDIVPLLIEFLDDPSWQIRAGAALALGALADPRALGPLLKARKQERGFKNRYLTREAYRDSIRAVGRKDAKIKSGRAQS